MAHVERRFLSAWRAQLLTDIQGPVLEIGAGTGVNFQYYDDDVSVLAIEPNPDMAAIAEKKRHHSYIKLHVASFPSETIETASIRTVVCTLVLCTIADAEIAITEIHRILMSDGELRIIEHVIPDTMWRRRLAHWLTPLWRSLAGGCELNRPTHERILKAGFKCVETRAFRYGVPFRLARYYKE